MKFTNQDTTIVKHEMLVRSVPIISDSLLDTTMPTSDEYHRNESPNKWNGNPETNKIYQENESFPQSKKKTEDARTKKDDLP